MNRGLTEKLLKKYPVVFGQHKLPMNQTAMCWGFECGDGWHTIIDALASIIQCENKRHQEASKKTYFMQAIQVKEKYGTLRFYMGFETDYVSGAIAMAEEMSARTCELCGSTQNVSQSEGWISTLCDKCHKKREDEKENI